MGFYKIIKIKGIGDSGKYIGYATPRMYRLDFNWRELRVVRLKFVKERLKGWTLWWVENEKDCHAAIMKLNEVKNILPIDYEVLVRS